MSPSARILFAASFAVVSLVGAGGMAGAAPLSGNPDGQGAPVATPPPAATDEAGDAGPLARLQASRAAAAETAPPAGLAARVASETQRLDTANPAQAPGATPPAGIAAWRQVGPTRVIHERVEGYTGPTQIKASESGRIRKILVDPRDPNVVYVLVGSGGLWKTTDFLQQHPTWTPLTDRLVSISAGSIAFGSSPDTLYLGLGDPFDNRSSLGGLMLKSTNGGVTWSSPVKLPDTTVVNDIAVDTSGPTDVVLVAADTGLFRSTDGGGTYTPIQHAPSDNPSTPVDEQLFTGTVVWKIGRAHV